MAILGCFLPQTFLQRGGVSLLFVFHFITIIILAKIPMETCITLTLLLGPVFGTIHVMSSIDRWSLKKG